MLGRKNYTPEEIDHARAAVQQQLAAYRRLAGENGSKPTDAAEPPADLGDFEVLYFNNMALVLDRYFVHRVRMVSGKDGNPLNEVEMIADSLMNNDGILRGNNVIKYVPGQSVVKLQIGERIQLTAEDFERLSTAFFGDLEAKYLQS